MLEVDKYSDELSLPDAGFFCSSSIALFILPALLLSSLL